MPGQGFPATVGVTVIVEVIGTPELFVATNAGKLPDPPAARPIAGFEFVHVYVAPAGTLVKAVAGTVLPAQVVMFAGTVTVGLGFTWTTKVSVTGEKHAEIGVPVAV